MKNDLSFFLAHEHFFKNLLYLPHVCIRQLIISAKHPKQDLTRGNIKYEDRFEVCLVVRKLNLAFTTTDVDHGAVRPPGSRERHCSARGWRSGCGDLTPAVRRAARTSLNSQVRRGGGDWGPASGCSKKKGDWQYKYIIIIYIIYNVMYIMY